MAYKTCARLFLISILLAIAGEAIAARDIPKTDDQMKQPEWLLKHDRSVLIPGLGRVLLPPHLKSPHIIPHYPYTGSTGSGSVGGGSTGSGSLGGGSTGSGSIGGSPGGARQIPGGDDTLVPNPGFEVPVPGTGAVGAGTNPRP
ncbi:hypothetical protein COLO4_35406 [Corchorus olitorius]|uniref:Cell wall protein n=1 Tax=Corchorus olitorius TaxID=93759 RepID=A0A1R3GH49_9ROSI|nr:hypothetical protein COLO4_35406 [Corchorus olitorius]